MQMNPEIVFRVHAVQRMFERSITEADVRQIVLTGEVIEDYPTDWPYPSKLMLGWQLHRPLHVVAAYNTDKAQIVIVTVYQPDPTQWTPDFRRRKE
jgi:hypothetical protein